MLDAHVPVLLHEAVEALVVKADGYYVDATFGRGGHTREILRRLGPRGRVIAFDRDASAEEAARGFDDPRLTWVHASFADFERVVRGVVGVADGLAGALFDLGVSSPQLDRAERGFSFRVDGPLDMRMDRSAGVTASQWLATASETSIKEVIRNYGEERFAGQIAKAIVAARSEGPITGTRQLAGIVGAAVRTREPGQDPATRTFQALRIHINQELAQLQIALPQALAALAPGGRLAVISFHSLEDRIVKRFMREEAHPEHALAGLPLRAHELPQPRLHIVGKPVRASAREIEANPRARSATLRVAEKV